MSVAGRTHDDPTRRNLRKPSQRLTALLNAAAQSSMPDGSELSIATIRGFPFYDGDVEAEHGLPDDVVKLKETIAAADGLLLVTPEHRRAGSVPS